MTTRWLCLALLAASASSTFQPKTGFSAAPVPTADAYPAWSPDGQTIAFQSNRTGDWEIFSIRVDGTGLRQLTANDGRDAHPSWSPDGKRIVFASVRNSSSSTAGRFRLFAMDPDGNNVTQLTDDLGEDAMPEWSPDGKRIVFLSDRSGKREAYLLTVPSGEVKPLTSTIRRRHTEVGNPHWSADGSTVVFDADYDGTYNFFAVNRDGSGLRQITHSPGGSGELFFPAYNKNGALAYSRLVDKDWKLFVSQPDSSAGRRLSGSATGSDFWPSWSPDGKQLVFASNRTGQSEIYLSNADGSGIVQLTHGGP